MMDAGCYCASLLRLVSGEEPRVTSAVAQLAPNSKVGGCLALLVLLVFGFFVAPSSCCWHTTKHAAHAIHGAWHGRRWWTGPCERGSAGLRCLGSAPRCTPRCSTTACCRRRSCASRASGKLSLEERRAQEICMGGWVHVAAAAL